MEPTGEQTKEGDSGRQSPATQLPSPTQERQDDAAIAGLQVQQPLLPHDGPLLAQQHQQHLAGTFGQEATMTADATVPTFPALDVNHLQQWISMLGHIPASSSLQGFQHVPGLHATASMPQSSGPDMSSNAFHAAAASDLRFLQSFQGMGAFAPIKPAQHGQDAAFATVARAGEGVTSSQQPPNAANFHALSYGSQEGPWAGQPSDSQPHHFSQQSDALPRQAAQRGCGPQQSQQSFDRLAGLASQHLPAGEAARGSCAHQEAPRQQPHKPPQATKSSRYRGVYKRQRGGRWEASIVHEGKNCRLGLHLTELAAAKAYDRVAIKKWGPQQAASKTNFDVNGYNLPELEAMSMNDLVQQVRAEWRTKEPSSGQATPSHEDTDDVAVAKFRHGAVDRAAASEHVAKRQRLADGQEAELRASTDEISLDVTRDAAQDEETRERVPVARSSIYRGVSTHKQSGKWVAQIKSGGKQVYLGFYTDQRDAARAYDQAVIHMQGEQAETNFPLEQYSDRILQLQEMDFKELVAGLKQHGRGGVPRHPKAETSRFRGVAPDKGKKWRSQITTSPKTTVYLGLWADEEGAARAYDRANIAKRGQSARTNFPVAQYQAELEQLRTMPFESLVVQLRAEAMASVTADKAAKQDLGGSTILAPSMEESEKSRYLQLENAGATAAAYLQSGLAGDTLPQYSATGATAGPQGTGYQIGQAQLGRYGVAPHLGLSHGYIIGRPGVQSPPDMLFRVVHCGPLQEEPYTFEHQQPRAQQ